MHRKRQRERERERERERGEGGREREGRERDLQADSPHAVHREDSGSIMKTEEVLYETTKVVHCH